MPPAKPPARVHFFVDWVLRRGAWIWAAALILSALAAWRTVHVFLALRSDLESLLPDDAPSVLALREMRSRMDGIRVLGVVVDAGGEQNLPKAEALLDALAARARTYPPELVAAVRTDVTSERAFFETHAASYIEREDLAEIRRRLEARKQWEEEEAAGVNLDDEPAPPVDLSDIESRYRAKDPAANLAANGRLTNPERFLTVMLVEVPGYSTGTAQYEALMSRLRADLAALGGPDAFAPGMSVGFAGTPALAVEELRSLQGDLKLSSLLVAAAVLAVLLLFFRWWRVLPALVLPLLMATALAFALASLPPFRITWVNSNTAFLGSIIVGNGINFGIILVARYVEERRAGAQVRDALVTAIHATRVGTITAAAAAAVAYGSLTTTQFRGFWQFGVIGGIGMMVCWASAYLLIPPLLAALDRKGGSLKPRRTTASLGGFLATLVTRHPHAVAGAGAALTLAALVGSRHFGAARFETDFSKLRRVDSSQTGARFWGQRMEAVLGQRLSPVVLLTDSQAQTLELARLLDQERSRDPVLAGLVDTVRTFQHVIPADQQRKFEEVAGLRRLLTPSVRARIAPHRLEQVDRLLGQGAPQAVSAEHVPASLVTGFRERDGSVDRVVLVYPKPGQDRWQGRSIMAFTSKLRELSEAATGEGQRAPRVAGQVPLSADITAFVLADAPRATAAALAGVLLLVLIAFRLSRETLLVLVSLAAGLSWLVWATMLLDIKINFVNFIGFPIAFGIGVDYAVNVLWRYRLDGGGDVTGAIRSTGGAVGLCSLTTIIGYSSLLLAENRGLFSFGLLSVIGEFTCLASAVLVVPAWLALRARRGAPRPVARDRLQLP
jgi:hypothetical protein